MVINLWTIVKNIYISFEMLDQQDVFVKHNAPDNGQFQRRPRSQGQILWYQ